jgi:flagellar biosynthesis/type III secretory pathway chaperone
MSNDKNMTIFYFQITDIWKRFCEAHQELFELTCDEYHALIKNNLDVIESITVQKEAVINYISELNSLREESIRDINLVYPEASISNVADLLKFVLESEVEKQEQHLNRFNNFLIDTIKKIQKQNDINQRFLKKAMTSIDEVRDNLLGKSRHMTYTPQGKTKTIMRRV